MKGTVKTFWGNKSTGMILGEDGTEYFFHASDVVNCKTAKVGNHVVFDAEDIGKAHLRAVNIKKVGHGKCHPFITNLRRLDSVIKDAPVDDEEKGYLLRDIQMMVNYFEEVEDYEWCKNLSSVFRPSMKSEGEE